MPWRTATHSLGSGSDCQITWFDSSVIVPLRIMVLRWVSQPVARSTWPLAVAIWAAAAEAPSAYWPKKLSGSMSCARRKWVGTSQPDVEPTSSICIDRPSAPAGKPSISRPGRPTTMAR